MWFPLNIKDYILKKKRKEHACEIYISDLRNIWFKGLKNAEILETVKELNPVFEASSNSLIETTLNLFNDNDKVKKEIIESANELTLKLSLKIGLEFKFQLILQKGDSDLFYNELTLPLLLITKKMNERERRLIDVIKGKDVEIGEYKIENVTIKRTHVITQPFIEKEFDNQEESNSALVDVSKNPSQFFDKICQNMLHKVAEVIEINEKEKLAQSSFIKKEQSSLDSNESPEKINELDKKINGDVKEEKVLLKVETYDAKRRKVQKISSKLRI